MAVTVLRGSGGNGKDNITHGVGSLRHGQLPELRAFVIVVVVTDVQGGEEVREEPQDVHDGQLVGGVGLRREGAPALTPAPAPALGSPSPHDGKPQRPAAAAATGHAPPRPRGHTSSLTISSASFSSCWIYGEMRECRFLRISSTCRADSRKPRACISHMHWLVCGTEREGQTRTHVVVGGKNGPPGASPKHGE